MRRTKILSCCRSARFSAIAVLAVCLQVPFVTAQTLIEREPSPTVIGKGQPKPLQFVERTKVNYDAYILGPGDRLKIELLDLPELSGSYQIGPDGTMYLPRLRALYVDGLTVEELRKLLTQQFKTYVRDPQIYVRPEEYRPIRVYVGGEVRRPGYYTLSGVTNLRRLSESVEVQQMQAARPDFGQLSEAVPRGRGLTTSGVMFPTVFDAIRSAEGVTPYTNLSQVQVTRKRAMGLGGGKIRTNLNFLSLITEGDESQNIRLFDGDVLTVGRSQVVLRDQLLKAGQSNLSPQFVEVFVTGRVNVPGGVRVPQGSSLNQAISLAGGPKLIRGRVEFVRFTREGRIDRRLFAYKPEAEANAPNNPVLASGDLIRINESILSGSLNVLNELTLPLVGLYSTYSLFSDN